MTATAYPLSWPQNMPRSRSRETGKFKTSLRARRLKDGWGWYWIPSAHVAAMGLHAEAIGQTPEGHPTPAILKRARWPRSARQVRRSRRSF